jgi:hypothetical protein
LAASLAKASSSFLFILFISNNGLMINRYTI